MQKFENTAVVRIFQGGVSCCYVMIYTIALTVVLASGFLLHNYFYDFFLISVLAIMPFTNWISKLLFALGIKSMDMWMIHSWFCYYLFKPFVYGFTYPIVIFVVLAAISYLTATITSYIADLISIRLKL